MVSVVVEVRVWPQTLTENTLLGTPALSTLRKNKEIWYAASSTFGCASPRYFLKVRSAAECFLHYTPQKQCVKCIKVWHTKEIKWIKCNQMNIPNLVYKKRTTMFDHARICLWPCSGPVAGSTILFLQHSFIFIHLKPCMEPMNR